jgi:hypothetical protein
MRISSHINYREMATPGPVIHGPSWRALQILSRFKRWVDKKVLRRSHPIRLDQNQPYHNQDYPTMLFHFCSSLSVSVRLPMLFAENGLSPVISAKNRCFPLHL